MCVRNILKKTKAALFVRACVCVCMCMRARVVCAQYSENDQSCFFCARVCAHARVVCAQYSEKDQSGSFCVCVCAREGVRACGVCVCVCVCVCARVWCVRNILKKTKALFLCVWCVCVCVCVLECGVCAIF